MRKAIPCHNVVMLAEYRSHLVAYYRSQQKIIKEKNVCTSKRAIYVASIIQQSIANLPVQRTYLYDVALPDPANNHPLFVKWPRGVLMSHMTSNLIWLCWLAGVWTGLCDAYYLFNEPVLQASHPSRPRNQLRISEARVRFRWHLREPITPLRIHIRRWLQYESSHFISQA